MASRHQSLDQRGAGANLDPYVRWARRRRTSHGRTDSGLLPGDGSRQLPGGEAGSRRHVADVLPGPRPAICGGLAGRASEMDLGGLALSAERPTPAGILTAGNQPEKVEIPGLVGHPAAVTVMDWMLADTLGLRRR